MYHENVVAYRKFADMARVKLKIHIQLKIYPRREANGLFIDYINT